MQRLHRLTGVLGLERRLETRSRWLLVSALEFLVSAMGGGPTAARVRSARGCKTESKCGCECTCFALMVKAAPWGRVRGSYAEPAAKPLRGMQRVYEYDLGGMSPGRRCAMPVYEVDEYMAYGQTNRQRRSRSKERPKQARPTARCLLCCRQRADAYCVIKTNVIGAGPH